MKKTVFILLQITVFCFLVSCSDSEEKSAIEKKQEQIGHEAAEAIKAPMEKAMEVQEMVDKQFDDTQKKIEEME